MARPYLSTWTAAWNDEWTREVEIVHPLELGPARAAARLLRLAPGRRAVVLRGAVGTRELYVDLLVGARIARTGTPVLLVDATWEPGSRLFRRLEGADARPAGPVDVVPVRGAGAIRAAVSALDTPCTHYGLLSSEELATFPERWGVPPERVHRVLFCAMQPEGTPASPPGRRPAVFAGGDSLRDYRALVAAAPALAAPLTVATRLPIGPSSDRRHRFGPLAPDAYDLAARAATVAVVPLLAGTARSAGQQTYLSAMLRGQATVVTDAPGVRDHVTHGHDGLVVPNEPRALAEAVNALLADADLADRLGRAARETVLERFTDRHFYRRVLGLTHVLADAAATARVPARV